MIEKNKYIWLWEAAQGGILEEVRVNVPPGDRPSKQLDAMGRILYEADLLPR